MLSSFLFFFVFSSSSSLKKIAYLLGVAEADVVGGQRRPQRAQHVGEAPQASADDGLDVETGDLVRVVADERAQVHPQLGRAREREKERER